METTERKLHQNLAFGMREVDTYGPSDKAVWGARLIAPADLVHDRQDLVSTDREAREALIHWLNTYGIETALAKCRRIQAGMEMSEWLPGNSDNSMVLCEDEKGIIVGSPQSSYGYVYVCGWLKS